MQRPKIERIEFKNMGCATPGGGKVIFDNVNVVLPANGIFWVQSKSGAGKTTLLRILNGLQVPQQGQYLVNNQSVDAMTFLEFTPFQLQFGLSFDFGGLIHNRTMFQNLSLILEYHKFFGDEEIQTRVHQGLQQFGIAEFAEARPSSCPGAVRKAICVMRAFIHNPQVLLLDDPTTGLRKEARMALIESIRQGTTENPDRLVLVASEDIDFIQDIQIDGTVIIQNQNIRIEDNKLRSAAA